jgi:lipopolysaccharide transport system permease protein
MSASVEQPSPLPAGAGRTIVIRPTSGRFAPRLHELWDYRELIYFLIWRDMKVRYKQTAIGAGWAVIQPLMMMVVFTVFLGHLAGIKSEGFPYPIFSFAALVPWTFFSQALGGATASLVGSANLISKVYFPRLILPVASAASFLIDLVIALGVLALMMVYYGIAPGWPVVLLPIFTAFALLTALAVGIWLTALNVRYRDIRYAVPFLIQLWLFASPVAYPATLVPQRWQTLYGLNPMAGVIEGFRWALLGTKAPAAGLMVASAGVVAVLLVGGLWYFRRAERTFADVV